MGRRLSAAIQKRRAELAEAREAYYRTRPASTVTTVRARKTDSAIYSSYLIVNSAASEDFRVSISDPAKTFFGGLTALGLRDPADVTSIVSIKPKGFKPAMVKAMVGTATPTASRSPWGTRVIKYSAGTTGAAQAHYQAPISGVDALVTYAEINTRANTIFDAVKGSLGSLDYARFVLEPEMFNVSKI